MKKQMKKELIALAERIVALKQQEIRSGELENLKAQAQGLYEKLTILTFTEKNINQPQAQQNPAPQNSVSREKSTSHEEAAYDKYAPDGTQFNDSESITEPNTEKIKDIVAQMPSGDKRMDSVMENLNKSRKRSSERNMEDIGGVHYDHLPKFEPASSRAEQEQKPRSLNDRLKNSLQIGVNERHSFVKHLFEGSNSDYDRVVSQLNTIKSKEEALNFVQKMVKPDYNNWEGKEELEIRFLAKVENKFEH